MSGQEQLKVALGAKNRSETMSAKVRVYGYTSANSPFFKEAKALKANSGGCLLILNAIVSRGQKLLLMSAAEQNPAEAEIVNTRSLTAQLYEVEVSFSEPRPDFWPVAGAQ